MKHENKRDTAMRESLDVYRQRCEELARENASLQARLELLRLDQQSGGYIQRRLLPRSLRVFSGVRFDYWLAPSLYLSGDFLGYQRYSDRYSAFYFADVSGHGASSAFVTVLLKYLFTRWLHEWDGKAPERMPADWLASLNRELQDSDIGKHATLFAGVIDHVNRTLHYSLGAQLPMPMLQAGGTLERLEGEGMPVGLFPDAVYPVLECALPDDFALWLCSDGVLECLPGKTLDARLGQLEQLLAQSASLEQFRDGLARTSTHVDLAKARQPDEASDDRLALPDDLTIMMVSGFGHAD
ncbi:hypothetical protein GCM10027172_09710 [Halomonas garicola]